MAGAHQALYFEMDDGGRVRCRLCPHNCLIAEGKTGVCGVRRNTAGTLVSDIYGEVTAIAMDPVEKKPLYHFFPGTDILSIGTKGCNLKCPYCQNYNISQDIFAQSSYYSPEKIADLAAEKGSIGVAYTYSEPIIWFEYVLDTAKAVKTKGLKNVMVTNGYINRGPLEELLAVIDAMNIDLKGFNEEVYRKVQRGGLKDVCAAIERVYESGCHCEITTLMVTGLNDTIEEMQKIIDYISGIDENIPWHISRYYPGYQYDRQETDIELMMRVYEKAREKLNYVYTGNIPSRFQGSDTLCPACASLLIKRTGYQTRIQGLVNGKCVSCGEKVPVRTAG